MTDTATKAGTTLLTVDEAAAYLRLSIDTLGRMRVRGGGPAFLKLGPKRVLYDQADLNRWLATRRRFSTNQTSSPI